MTKVLKDIQTEVANAIKDGKLLRMKTVEGKSQSSILGRPINVVFQAERIQKGIPQPVDLGLSVFWASRNFGATSEEKVGFYVRWGEITTEESSSLFDDDFCMNPPKCICGSHFDIVRCQWEESWRYPTIEEIKELMQHCRWDWLEINEVPGFRVTGENGNSIFLPAGGSQTDGEFDGNAYNEGLYWSGECDHSDLNRAYLLDFSKYEFGFKSLSRHIGLLIRPVLNKEDQI